MGFNVNYHSAHCALFVMVGKENKNQQMKKKGRYYGHSDCWCFYSLLWWLTQQSFLDDNVQLQGWILWSGVSINNLFYAEFNNCGSGADTTHRVNWPNFHVIERKLAKIFTVENFINGTDWLLETGVSFKIGFYFILFFFFF